MGDVARRTYAPRLPLAQRREQLLDAALWVIDEKGYRGVSIDAIAQRANVSRPVVYDAMGDLTSLLTALLEREEQRAFAVLGSVLPVPPPTNTDPIEMLVEGLASLSTAVAADPRPWRLMLLSPEGTPPEVRDHVELGRRTIVAWLEELVRWAAERFGVDDTDPELAAHALLGVGEQVARLAIADPERYNPDRVRRLGRSLAGMLLAEAPRRVSVAPDGSAPALGDGETKT